jgi:hypothetical protein
VSLGSEGPPEGRFWGSKMPRFWPDFGPILGVLEGSFWGCFWGSGKPRFWGEFRGPEKTRKNPDFRPRILRGVFRGGPAGEGSGRGRIGDFGQKPISKRYSHRRVRKGPILAKKPKNPEFQFVPNGRVIKYPPKCAPPRPAGPRRRAPPGALLGDPSGGGFLGPSGTPKNTPPGRPFGQPNRGILTPQNRPS